MAEQPTAVNTAGHPIHTIPHQHQHQHQQHQKQQTQHEEALAPGRIGGFIFGKNMWFDTSDMLLWGGNAILGMALIGVWGSGIPALRGLGAPFTRTAKVITFLSLFEKNIKNTYAVHLVLAPHCGM